MGLLHNKNLIKCNLNKELITKVRKEDVYGLRHKFLK